MSKTAQGTTEKKGRETKKIPLKPIIAAAAVLVLIILIMAVEAVNTEKLIIKNDTSEDIEWIQLYFENTEEDAYDILTREAGVSIASGENLQIRCKLPLHEANNKRKLQSLYVIPVTDKKRSLSLFL